MGRRNRGSKKKIKLHVEGMQLLAGHDTESALDMLEYLDVDDQVPPRRYFHLKVKEAPAPAPAKQPFQPVEQVAPVLEHAPDEVLEVLLTKLDVKGIAACPAVCIDSPKFARQWNIIEHDCNSEKPVYIARQDEKCKAVGDLKEGCHRFLDFEKDSPSCTYVQTGRMKLMATTYALMCFLEGDRQLVVVNPLTGQVRKLPLWATEQIVSVGIHFDRFAGEYTVIAAAADGSYFSHTLYMAIYHSAAGSWSQIENRNTSYHIKKTSPIVWFEGAFYWTVGTDKDQLILKFDESRNKWTDITPNGKFSSSSCYETLSLVDDELRLGDQWRVHTEGVGRIARAATPLSPVKSFVVCYSDTASGKMVLQMIGDHNECYKPDENESDIFTIDYMSRPKHCYISASMRFEFTYGLGI